MFSTPRFSFLFARRYLVSKKTHHLINIITFISIIGITTGTAALFVVLSVFNGFENLVLGLFNQFNSDIVILPAKGKTFEEQALDQEKLYQWPGVKSVVQVLEENALLKYQDKQFIASLKGVDSSFTLLPESDSILIEGEYRFQKGPFGNAVMGYGVAYSLGIRLDDYLNPVEVFLPDRKARNISVNPESFRHASLVVSGVFSIQQEIDEKYVLTSLSFVRDLLDAPKELSSVEIRLLPGTDLVEFQQHLKSSLGKEFVIKNRFEQEELLYRVLKSERRAIFIILTFILLVATFNVLSSMSMLILEKRRDIKVLHAMGASKRLIRSVFFTEGTLIVIIGAVFGLAAGGILCLLQQHFGFVKLGGGDGNFVVSAYPIAVKFADALMIFFTVLFIGILASIIPVLKISTQFLKNRTV